MSSQVASWSAAVGDPSGGAIKRPSDSLYHPTLLGAYTSTGQSDDWFSTNKRPRFETASNLSIYPQRPGEKDCAYYMRTRTCMFGDTCRFDHPLWVPEGGIPDWKEVPLDAATAESFPERPGEPDCPFFIKTKQCKYGLRCKFNHPKDKLVTLDTTSAEISNLPDRPAEPPCAFYMKTGICKFGATCKFHHPKDIVLQTAEQGNTSAGQNVTAAIPDATTGQVNQANPPITPALYHNSKGLPVRPGEVDCPFYLKTGSCKYSATCRYNHPERFATMAAAVGQSLIPSPAAHLTAGLFNPAALMMQAYDPRFTQTAVGMTPTVYPQRPGQVECDFYMKSGECKFGERCKFHHPIDRTASTVSAKDAQQNVKLTLAGLPRREGSVHCPYYMKTGACKYGANCKFDHPPPGEVLATVATTATAEEEKEDE